MLDFWIGIMKWCLIVNLCVAARTTSGQSQASAVPSQVQVASLLRHQEDLVQSMQCEYDFIVSPTRPEMVSLLRKLGHVNKHPNYVISGETARAWSYSAHWWRKGQKERLDARHAVGRSLGKKSTAFDGNVVRSAEYQGEKVTGSITPGKDSNWMVTVRTEPYALLYEYLDMPYSDVIAKGSKFTVSQMTKGNKPFTKVSVQHPTIKTRRFDFIFDDASRLVERAHFRLEDDNSSYVTAKYVFGDYKTYLDESGETIWFPQEVVIHRYTDPFEKGVQVEWVTEKIVFKTVRFNIPIPDEQFVIEYPENAKIYDQVTGQGWLPTSEDHSTLWTDPPVETPGRHWWLIGLGVTALAAVLFAAWMILSRRRRTWAGR